MSAASALERAGVPGPVAWRSAARTAPGDAQVLLLGVGSVGGAFLRRWARVVEPRGPAGLRLVAIADSRRELVLARGLPLAAAADTLASLTPGPRRGAALLGARGTRILVDATASDEVASCHARWLRQGIHVVTACKLGQGGPLPRWHAIRQALAHAGASYGDAATVGAGLPLLRTLRALRDGGDRVHGLAGVLSGSLGWLFSHYDGRRPFSTLLREAQRAGYTEPDPRDDLSGEDVRRKLLILARSAGVELEADAIRVESLLPAELAALPRARALAALERLDAPLQRRLDAAQAAGRRLRYVARLDAQGARVGLEALPPADPLAQDGGCDNRLAIHSDRYDARPLVLQGPGAGADVTAAALLDEVLAIAAGTRRSFRGPHLPPG